MGKYFIKVTQTAKKDLERIYISGNKTDILRVEKIFVELENTPTFGIGKPEKLKGNLSGCCGAARAVKKNK